MLRHSTPKMLQASLLLLVVGCGGDDSSAQGSSSLQTDAGSGAACKAKTDCPKQTPTVQCMAGMCEDTIWGCVGTPDARQAPTESTATFKIKVHEAGRGAPIQVPVSARACPPPAEDPSCAAPIPGTTAVYDNATGLVTVTGLPQDRTFRLLITPEPSSNLVGIDFYANRPPRDTTEGAQILQTLSLPLIQSFTSFFDPPIQSRLDSTSLSAVFLDCAGAPGAGVTFAVGGTSASDSKILYLGSDLLPDARRTDTSPQGAAVVVNLDTNKLLTVSAKIGALDLPPFQVLGQPGHLTILHLYPRNYAQ